MEDIRYRTSWDTYIGSISQISQRTLRKIKSFVIEPRTIQLQRSCSFQYITCILIHVSQITTLYKTAYVDGTVRMPECQYKVIKSLWSKFALQCVTRQPGWTRTLWHAGDCLDLIWIPPSNTMRTTALSRGTKTSHNVQANRIRKKVLVFYTHCITLDSLQTPGNSLSC